MDKAFLASLAGPGPTERSNRCVSDEGGDVGPELGEFPVLALDRLPEHGDSGAGPGLVLVIRAAFPDALVELVLQVGVRLGERDSRRWGASNCITPSSHREATPFPRASIIGSRVPASRTPPVPLRGRPGP